MQGGTGPEVLLFGPAVRLQGLQCFPVYHQQSGYRLRHVLEHTTSDPPSATLLGRWPCCASERELRIRVRDENCRELGAAELDDPSEQDEMTTATEAAAGPSTAPLTRIAEAYDTMCVSPGASPDER